MKKFKPGQKVKTVENHEYLGVSKRMKGTVISHNRLGLLVVFNLKSSIRRHIYFDPGELKAVK